MPTLSSLTDKAIGALFPGWGLKRQIARYRMDAMAKLAPLQSSTMRKSPGTNTEAMETELPFSDRKKMINLARNHSRTDPLFAGILNRLVANVIPPSGLRPEATTKDTGFNDEAEAYYLEWAETCETRKILSFWDYQKVFLRSVLVEGDLGNVFTNNGKLQGIEADRIDTPQQFREFENLDIIQGVKLDSIGAPTHYWVGYRNKYGALDKDSWQPVEARFFHHGYICDRFDMYRGISSFLAGFDNFRDFKDILNYAKNQQKMAAVFGISIETEKGMANPIPVYDSNESYTNSASGTSDVLPTFDLFPGMGVHLNHGQKVQTIENRNPNDNFLTFIELIARLTGGSVSSGLPIELVLLDFHRGNYSSQRMALRAAYKTYLNLYACVRKFCQRTWNWQISRAAKYDGLKPPRQIKDSYWSHDWSLPVEEMLDPEKEVKAKAMEVAHGQNTLTAQLKAVGKDIKKQAETRGREIKILRDNGVPVIIGDPGTKTLAEIDALIAKAKNKIAKGKNNAKE